MNNDMNAIALKQAEDAKNAVVNIEMITRDPMKAQEGFLLKLLDDNKDTEYGKKYGFADIHSINEYQKRVPVTTYDDYAEYIRRMSENGERNLITAYDMAFYNMSSGTVGKPKRIPMTKIGLDKFMMYNQSYEVGKLGQLLGGTGQGRLILLTLSNPNISIMPDGLPLGAVSDTVTIKAKPFWTRLYTSPVDASFVVPGVDSRYLHARYALMDPNPGKINCSCINAILEFFKYIEQNWKLLVNDIENGTIDSSISLPEDVRASLIQGLVPAPERAKELRNIFEQGFDAPIAAKLWPQLKVVCGAATGTFKIYADKMQERYTGNLPIYRRGIGASEGVFSVPVKLDSCDSVLIPDSVFFEFLPEESEDLSSLITLNQLEVGKKYEMFITNLSGLYRYRMKDVVLVTGIYNNTPTIEFQYRSDKCVNLVGEKTSEVALRTAVEMTAKQCGFELVESTMYPDVDNSQYVFILETENMPEDLGIEEVRAILESQLETVNPCMGDIIQKKMLEPAKLYLSKPGTFAQYREMLLKKGYSIGQVKPVTVITNETQREFFFSMIMDV